MFSGNVDKGHIRLLNECVGVKGNPRKSMHETIMHLKSKMYEYTILITRLDIL